MQEMARQLQATPTEKKPKSNWEAATIELHSASGGSLVSRLFSSSRQKPVRVNAKKSCYYGPHIRWVIEVPVSVFVTEKGATWVGPQQDFYVETESGVVGGKKWGDAVLWCESLLGKRANENSDLDTLLARFDKEVDGNALMTAYNGGYPRGESYLKRLTDFRWVLLNIYGQMPDSGGDISGVQVEGNTVRLDLKGCTAESSATVWIDITTKKLLKAVEDGKQVFPK